MMIFVGCTKQPPKAVDFVAFDAGSACVIVVPEKATEPELRAARLLQQTLAKAAGRSQGDFAIVQQAPAGGAVLAIRGLSETNGPKLTEWVAWNTVPGRLEITAYPAEAIEAATACFLERSLGAHWFMPGELGEHIPRRAELRLPTEEVVFRPNYISRNLWVGSGEAGREWARVNRLRSWFNHTHMMSALFKREDLRANPELAPLISGRKYIPVDDGQQGWQPNIIRPAAAEHAARRLRERQEFSSAIGMNDGIGFDQSEETRQFLGEPKWFRLRPDFSPLVFRFTNEVAKRLPDRYLGAYAYYWTEAAPLFPVERNVVPYLTADRSEWFDPDFAEADKALIKKWAASGAEVVGLYDYYYGSPFFVPRPTLYAATEVIPFASETGVKAFYAEVFPNWALDGPKAWVAAQLLWDSKVSPDALLNTYYTEFWREAAGPMRAFYALCDDQWRHQPKPTYWLKYYKDEQQHLLFPAEVRRELRGLLDRAMAGATTELTRNRLRFASAGFAVTEAFCTWNETREKLSRAALQREFRPEQLQALMAEYAVQLDALKRSLAEVKSKYPDAIQSELLAEYTRDDSRKRAEWRLAVLRSQKSESALAGPELLTDADLSQLVVGPTSGFFDLRWVTTNTWFGSGEPYQTRNVTLERLAGGNELRMTGCKRDILAQWVPAVPGKKYLVRAKVRGKVSPGNTTALILNFMDEKNRTTSLGLFDRLPVGTYDGPVELVTLATAPAGTVKVGIGAIAQNQVADDFVVFTDFSLREVLAP